VKDHSNPLSRPYIVRLKEQGFIYKVELPVNPEEYLLDNINLWLYGHGYKSKHDYVMSNWSFYFKDEKLAIWFRLKWT